MNRRRIKKIQFDFKNPLTGAIQRMSYLLSEQCLQCKCGTSSTDGPYLCMKSNIAGTTISEKIRLGALCNDYKPFESNTK